MPRSLTLDRLADRDEIVDAEEKLNAFLPVDELVTEGPATLSGAPKHAAPGTSAGGQG
jgi:hypothetical protein